MVATFTSSHLLKVCSLKPYFWCWFCTVNSFRLKETKASQFASGNGKSQRFIDKKHKNHHRLYIQALWNWILVLCHLGCSNSSSAWKTTPIITPLPHPQVVIHCFLVKSLRHPRDTVHLSLCPCSLLLNLLMASVPFLLSPAWFLPSPRGYYLMISA